MSAEELLNRASENVETAPTADYTPLPEATREPDRKEYGNDADSIRDAASDLAKAREERGATAQAEPIDRGYLWLSGDKAGEPVESNFTVDAVRARQMDVEARSPTVGEVQGAIDQARDFAQQQEQPAQQTEQPQPQEQPHDPNDAIRQALSNPAVRQALEAEVASVEQARGQYQQATLQAAQMSAAAVLSAFPELQNIPANQMETAVRLIAAKDPARGQAIHEHMQRTQNLYQASQQAAAQQQQLQAQQLNRWVQQQDQLFEESVKHEPVETVKEVKANAARIAREYYGISEDELRQAYQTNPAVRSAAFGKMMYDATRWHLTQESLKAHKSNPVVPVQRPGVTQPRGDDGDVSAAMKRFQAEPTPKNAADLLVARRAARSR